MQDFAAPLQRLIDEFRRRYPKIVAEYFRTGGPQLVERIFTEARAGKHLWDVFMNSAIYTQLLIERSMLAVYQSPESRFYRDGYKDPRGTWTSIYTNYAVAGYNTKLVAKDEVPKSYSDLLKPVWTGQIGMDVIQQIRTIYDNYGFDTQILAASIRHPIHVLECALAGADVATVPYKVFEQLIHHPLTDVGLANFLKDWEKTKKAAAGKA